MFVTPGLRLPSRPGELCPLEGPRGGLPQGQPPQAFQHLHHRGSLKEGQGAQDGAAEVRKTGKMERIDHSSLIEYKTIDYLLSDPQPLPREEVHHPPGQAVHRQPDVRLRRGQARGGQARQAAVGAQGALEELHQS